jgi:pimeloyl-ACP methyl ester carboxylesterase
MHGELVRIEAEDGLELVGFYATPTGRPARRAVLHVHGMSGNFYENLFVSTVGEAVLAKGLAFLTVNNRGHEYASDNVRRTPEGGVFSKGGATWEVFDECVFDVGGGARYLASRGHEGIYFEGHSLGCLKVAHYLAERRDPRAAGAVLLSPADMFGIRAQNSRRPLEDLVREARALTAAGKGDTLMPDAGYEVPLSAAMVASVYGDPRKTDIFPFRLGDRGDYRVLSSLAVPLLVVYGTLYEAVTVPVADALALARAHATSSPAVTTVAVEGGDHIYLGHEDELAQVVASFVEA